MPTLHNTIAIPERCMHKSKDLHAIVGRYCAPFYAPFSVDILIDTCVEVHDDVNSSYEDLGRDENDDYSYLSVAVLSIVDT